MVANSTYQSFMSKKTTAFTFSASKPITLSIPTNKVDIAKTKRAFLANLVHSLDGVNIHLLVDLILSQQKNMPLYTIHDCFATTLNNMAKLESLVKKAFIIIYFQDDGYLTAMHNHIIDDLKAKSLVKDLIVNDEPVIEDGEVVQVVQVKGENVRIPRLPQSTSSQSASETFVTGILGSEFFIS